jgi:hypothetical protein
VSVGQSLSFPILTSAFISVELVIFPGGRFVDGVCINGFRASASLSDVVSLGASDMLVSDDVADVVGRWKSLVRSGNGGAVAVDARGWSRACRLASRLVIKGVGVDGLRDRL